MDQMDYTLVCPPPKLCTDNGIMIAWNGMEKWKAGIGIADSIDSVDIEPKYSYLLLKCIVDNMIMFYNISGRH